MKDPTDEPVQVGREVYVRTVSNALASAYTDGRAGRGYSEETTAAQMSLLAAYVYLEERIARARDEAAAAVPVVQPEADPTGDERGSDLLDVRRMAPDPGAAERAALRAGIAHNIMTGLTHLAVLRDPESGSRNLHVARFYLWTCGPCRVQNQHATAEKRADAIAWHLGG